MVYRECAIRIHFRMYKILGHAALRLFTLYIYTYIYIYIYRVNNHYLARPGISHLRKWMRRSHSVYPYLRHFTYPLVKHMTLAAFNNDLKVCDAQ